MFYFRTLFFHVRITFLTESFFQWFPCTGQNAPPNSSYLLLTFSLILLGAFLPSPAMRGAFDLPPFLCPPKHRLVCWLSKTTSHSPLPFLAQFSRAKSKEGKKAEVHENDARVMTTQMMPASNVVSAMDGADGILLQRSVHWLPPPPSPFYFVFCKQQNNGIHRKDNLHLKTDTEFE